MHIDFARIAHSSCISAQPDIATWNVVHDMPINNSWVSNIRFLTEGCSVYSEVIIRVYESHQRLYTGSICTALRRAGRVCCGHVDEATIQDCLQGRLNQWVNPNPNPNPNRRCRTVSVSARNTLPPPTQLHEARPLAYWLLVVANWTHTFLLNAICLWTPPRYNKLMVVAATALSTSARRRTYRHGDSDVTLQWSPYERHFVGITRCNASS